MLTVTRYHDIAAGHRVFGHESKCSQLHGHGYRIHFTCQTTADENGVDALGRVIDFSVIKGLLCEWLEKSWDHKMLLWEKDSLFDQLAAIGVPGLVRVPFNPTAENMAKYLVDVVGPQLLKSTGVRLVQCRVDETRKCSATYELAPGAL